MEVDVCVSLATVRESTQVTSKPKRQQIGRFEDVSLVGSAGSAPHPTVIFPALKPRMEDQTTGGPSHALLHALHSMFDILSSNGLTLSDQEQVPR